MTANLSKTTSLFAILCESACDTLDQLAGTLEEPPCLAFASKSLT